MSDNEFDKLLKAIENNDTDAVNAMKRRVPGSRLRQIMSPWRQTQKDGSILRSTQSVGQRVADSIRFRLHSSVKPGPTYPVNVCTVGVVSCEVLDEHVVIVVDDPKLGAIGQRVSDV